MTDAAALTRRLGGKWHGGYGTARCPAHEDQSPSFSIRDGDRGLLLRCFAGCDPRDVYDALKRRGLIDDRPERHPTRSIHEQPLRRQQHDKAVWLWSQRRPIVGTIAEHYLRRARGYEGPLPATLGFLPPRKPEHPLIAAFAISDEPEPGLLGEPRDVTAVHLTLLKPDGSGKADTVPNKLIIGSPRGCRSCSCRRTICWGWGSRKASKTAPGSTATATFDCTPASDIETPSSPTRKGLFGKSSMILSSSSGLPAGRHWTEEVLPG